MKRAAAQNRTLIQELWLTFGHILYLREWCIEPDETHQEYSYGWNL